MTPEQARALFLDHCRPGDRGTLERYGEKAAVAAILAAVVSLSEELISTYEELIDHNGDSMDDFRANRVAELRAATPSQNTETGR